MNRLLENSDLVRRFISRKAPALGLSCMVSARFTHDAVDWSTWQRPAVAGWAPDTEFEAGCLAKWVTHLLVMEAVRDGLFELSTPVERLVAGPLDGVLVRHLLEHSHGLDGADVHQAPLASDGRIALRAVLDRLETRERIHGAGRLFNYGHLGYILLGGLLETVRGVRFDELVKARLCALGIGESRSGTWRCPATGAGGLLSPSACVAIARHYWFGLGSTARDVLTLRRPLPGFSWRDSGCSLGWRCEDRAWFLWVGSRVGGTAALRFNPKEGVGSLVAGPDERVKALGEQLLELLWQIPAGALHRPAPLCTGPSAAHSFEGSFADSESRFTIAVEDGGLRVDAMRSPQGASAVSTVQRLRAIGAGLFLAFPPDRRGLHLAEFIAEDNGDRVSHLWNGARAWRRIG
jgi:hypothetical protein